MTGSFLPNRRKIVEVLWKSSVVGGIIVLALVRYFWGGECPVLRYCGIPCPSCGMTRAWISCFCGKFSEAFSYNFMFPAVPILVLYFYRDGKLFPWRRLNYVFLVAIAFGFLIKFILTLIFCG
jgi:hypothetical protein